MIEFVPKNNFGDNDAEYNNENGKEFGDAQ